MSELAQDNTAASLHGFLQGYWGGTTSPAHPVGRRLTVRCRTRLPLELIEAWLEENCPGGWDIVISGILEDEAGAVWKRLEVVFAAADECARFRAHLAKST